jgi:hypothetical protein
LARAYGGASAVSRTYLQEWEQDIAHWSDRLMQQVIRMLHVVLAARYGVLCLGYLRWSLD